MTHPGVLPPGQPDPLPPASRGGDAAVTARASASALASESLLQGRREVAICHQGVIYRLQATRQGKLILTK